MAASVFVVFALYGYLCAVRQAFEGGIAMADADRIVVRHRVSIILPVPRRYESRIEELPGVLDATPITWLGGVFRSASPFFPQFAVEPLEYLAMHPEIALSPGARAAWEATRDGAVAGRDLARRHGWRLGERVAVRGSVWPRRDGRHDWEFTIVGIYDAVRPDVDTGQFLFRHDFFDDARPEWARGQVGWYTVRIDRPERAPHVAAAIDATFENSPDETRSEPELAFVQAFANQVGDIGAITEAVLASAFFTLLLVNGNTMAHAFGERQAEFGVLMALGLSPRHVVGLMGLESCCLSVVPGLAGLLAVRCLVGLGDPSGGALPHFSLPTRSLGAGVALTAGLGAIGSLPPALIALWRGAAEALRGG